MPRCKRAKNRSLEVNLKKLFLLVSLCITLSIVVPAQQRMNLTPDQAVELAIKNNLSLESSRVASETRRRTSSYSWNQFIPTVDVGGALLRLNQPPQPMTIDLSDFGLPPFTMGGGVPQWRVAGSISAILNLNFAMFEDMKKLRFDYEKGLISYQKAKAQLERDVRKSYHNILLVQENVALLKSSFENVERQVTMAQANYNAGLVPELTVLQAQVALENLRPTIDQVENGLKLAMASFSMNLGLDYDTEFDLVPIESNPDFIPIDVAEMISKASSGKLDVQELRHEILALNSQRKSVAYRLFTPFISLSWSADPTFSGDPWKDPWFENMDNWTQQSGNFRISLGFRLNGLLPFSTERQGLKAIDDGIKMANIGLAQLIYGTELEIYNTVLSLERIRISTEALQHTVNLAERSYRLTEQAYQAGLQDHLSVANAEQSLRQARVQLLEQQFNYLNGLLDLEYATGVTFGTLSSNRSLK
jgi:outer membrane protein TolC